MRILQWVMACAVAIGVPAHAQKACSKADAANAEKTIERVVSWQTLRKAYVDYKHCDSDKVAEIYTDAMMRLLVGWKNLDAIAGDYGKDADYKAWINKHLMSEAAKDDREDVYALAKKSCPKGQESFCTELAGTVKPVKAEPLKPFNLDPLPTLK